MFKHILLPTDGSKLSERAVRLGIRLLDAIARQARSRRVR
ncbi:MAG TPA: universal stress protein [Burkholderiales bacterium]